MPIRGVGRDLRVAGRVLSRAPGFSVTVVLTLAVAVGINTAVFTVVDSVLLRPLPYPRPGELGLVQATIATGSATETMTSQHGVTWNVVRDHATTVDRAVFSTWTTGVNVVAGGEASFAGQQRVGSGFFSVLGVLPAVGREFSAEEDRRGGPLATILSHEYWRTLGADASIVGTTMTLRGEPHTVVGIMPAGFHSGVDADLWTPLRATPDGEGEGENYQILLRRRQGATWTDANAELGALGSEIASRRPAPQGAHVTFSTVPLKTGMTADARVPLLMLWAAVGLVLLVACVNLAGLLLARTGARSREIATRLALGAARTVVVRQLLLESAVLGAIGGVVGLGLGAVSLDVLRGGLADLGIWQPLHIDGRSVAAALILALGSSLLFGLVPSLVATRTSVRTALVGTSGRTVAGHSPRRMRQVIVVAQVAIGVVLLAGAALLVRTFIHLHRLDPGFDGRHVITATVSLQDARYSNAPRVTQLVDATLARLSESAGVVSAAVSLGLPYERLLNLGFRHLDGPHAADPQGRMTSAAYVAGDYFGTLRIPLRAGRTFTPADTPSSPGVVVVNEALARRYFDNQSPVGRRIAFAGRERAIVGVVGDVQVKPGFGDHGPLAPMPLAYIPLSQANDGFLRLVHGWFSPSFLVRTEIGATATALPAVRAAVDATDPLLPFAKVRSLDDVKAAALAEPRLFMILLVTLAATAVLLVGIGIHGLVAAAVAERTREMGIRLALGATTSRAVRTLAMPGIVLALVGTVIGGLAARSAASVIEAFVWGVRPTDPATFALVALLVVVVAAVASLVPALRILRLDPAITLRAD